MTVVYPSALIHATYLDDLSLQAAILQQTADYIYQLEQEKTRLLAQNSQLKRLLDHQHALNDSDGGRDSPIPKRKKASPGMLHLKFIELQKLVDKIF